jgi:hypothetical protein
VVPFETQTVGGVLRYRHNVGVIRIPEADRDVVRVVLSDDQAIAERGYRPVMGADAPDDDPMFPAGDPVALDGAVAIYTLMLTLEEATTFRAASNARYVNIDPLVRLR